VGPDELFQRAVIARRYYLEGRTRVEIAEEFGLSRFKVARVLEEALESGMVEITIHDPGSIDVEVSTALQRRYSLQHAYAVAADATNTADRVEAVAKAMAELLQSIVRPGDVIGVDCGRTMTHIAPYLNDLPQCDVVQLTGLAGALTTNGADLARRISAAAGGKSSTDPAHLCPTRQGQLRPCFDRRVGTGHVTGLPVIARIGGAGVPGGRCLRGDVRLVAGCRWQPGTRARRAADGNQREGASGNPHRHRHRHGFREDRGNQGRAAFRTGVGRRHRYRGRCRRTRLTSIPKTERTSRKCRNRSLIWTSTYATRPH
jgi:HAMP domain-containing protein